MSELAPSPQIDRLLAPGGLEYVFQPVVELGAAGAGAQPHYLEALARGPAGTNLRSASVLFEYARRKGRAAEIDRLCLSGALRSASSVRPTPNLGVNVHASTLERDPDFVDFVLGDAERHGLMPDRLTLEIVEHAPRWSGRHFARALASLREAGVRLALDDVGLGQSNYRMLLDCRPEYLKVDAYIVHGCDRDPGRIAVLESLVLLADRLGSRVIAEGVERQEELRCLQSLGIELLQGFLLAEPAPIGQLEQKRLALR